VYGAIVPVNVVVADEEPEVAVMVTGPILLTVTRPDAFTDTTVLSELDHETDAPTTATPEAFLTSAVSCAVAPTSTPTLPRADRW